MEESRNHETWPERSVEQSIEELADRADTLEKKLAELERVAAFGYQEPQETLERMERHLSFMPSIWLVLTALFLVCCVFFVYCRQEADAFWEEDFEISAPVAADFEIDENQMIQAALLERAHKIEDCAVTWYTADTCGKTPVDPAYGITASGMEVVENLTCAVDFSVIPMFSEVFVEYPDGTKEHLWATDTGVSGNAVDVYTPDYAAAIQNGRQTATVYWIPPVGNEVG